MDKYRHSPSPEQERELGINPVYERDKHDPGCKWPKGRPCTKFSTDGTLLGAEIAHTMGTTDERKIAEGAVTKSYLSGMEEEQADWEDDE